MIIYQEFLAINEDQQEQVMFEPNERLRYAIHEIVIKLKKNEEIKIPELVKRLEEYKIYITVDILEDLLDEFEWKKIYTVFKKEDGKWLDVYKTFVKKKIRDKQNFGKHRRKLDIPPVRKQVWSTQKRAWIYEDDGTPVSTWGWGYGANNRYCGD
jgi:hypothetical protein